MNTQSEFLFTSERLGFRHLKDSDIEYLEKLDMDPDVRAMFPDGVMTPEQVRERLDAVKASYRENGFGDFAAIDLETGIGG